MTQNDQDTTQRSQATENSLVSRITELEEENLSLWTVVGQQATDRDETRAKDTAERDAEIKTLRDVKADLEQKLKTAQQDLASVQELSERRKKEEERLLAQNAQLMRNLEGCTDRIFQMQPPKVATDEEISNAYACLRKSISDWVAGTVEELDDGFLGRSFDVELHRNGLPYLIRCPEGFNWAPLEALLLQCHIFGFIYLALLHPQRIWPGMHPEMEKLLNHIIHGLDKISPRKGLESIQMWQGDLQRALSTLVLTKNQMQARLNEIARQAMQEMASLLAEHSNVAPDWKACEKLINEAGTLALTMRESHIKYDFDFGQYNADRRSGNVMLSNDIGKFEIFDRATGQPIPRRADITSDEDGHVGRRSALVFPGLTRQSRRDEVPLVLQKPVIVVAFDHPVTRITRPKNTESVRLI
ncbi:uncharacterized protein AB675_2164 [Cyphellophora attinorum]|uniref:Uncharacterized protein n=1 Tax=Cyphellophora attinorum TaxID=1664694 RepID=A0A0N1HDV1_9EURO|nr:uncharacterized protein AB675_2164 [Phialophora attinorum]KPI42953.1 hypothetical protein AB675_2164 [Phialophora attinorum]